MHVTETGTKQHHYASAGLQNELMQVFLPMLTQYIFSPNSIKLLADNLMNYKNKTKKSIFFFFGHHF